MEVEASPSSRKGSSSSTSRSTSALAGANSPASSSGKKRPREENQPIPASLQEPTTVAAVMSNGDDGSSNGSPSKSPKIASATSGSEAALEKSLESSSATLPTSSSPQEGERHSGAATAAEKEKRATDDLLVPLADFDWTAFLSKCEAELKEVEGEEAALLEEYHSWGWVSFLLCLTFHMMVNGEVTGH
jgi:hypothetical protein